MFFLYDTSDRIFFGSEDIWTCESGSVMYQCLLSSSEACGQCLRSSDCPPDSMWSCSQAECGLMSHWPLIFPNGPDPCSYSTVQYSTTNLIIVIDKGALGSTCDRWGTSIDGATDSAVGVETVHPVDPWLTNHIWRGGFADGTVVSACPGFRIVFNLEDDSLTYSIALALARSIMNTSSILDRSNIIILNCSCSWVIYRTEHSVQNTPLGQKHILLLLKFWTGAQMLESLWTEVAGHALLLASLE